MYHLAATNARVSGALIALFITKLGKTFGLSNDKFHLIGNSLGCHVVAYAGKRLKHPQIARITGLDPAGSLSLSLFNYSNYYGYFNL